MEYILVGGFLFISWCPVAAINKIEAKSEDSQHWAEVLGQIGSLIEAAGASLAIKCIQGKMA